MIHFIEMDVLKSDENQTVEDVEIEEITPLNTDEGNETIPILEYQFKSNEDDLQMSRRTES